MTVEADVPAPDGGATATPAPTVSALTANEQALWLFLQDATHTGVLNVPFAVRMADRVRWWPLNEALLHLIGRHPALRTLFPAPDGVPARHVLDPADPLATRPPLHVRATTDHRLDTDLKRFAAQPFDLAHELPFRLGQFIAEQGDVLCVVVSHLVYDAFSARVLVQELFELYDIFAGDATVPAALAGEVLPPPAMPPNAASLAYWREQLAGAQDGRGDLLIGTPGPRSGDFPGADITVTMDAGSTTAIASLSEHLSLTANLVAFGAFNLMLSIHGMGEDVVVGLPVSARGGRPHRAIGYHVNIIALRTRLSLDMSFQDYLRHTREVFLNGLLHSSVSVDEVRPGSYDDDAAGGRPLFRHMFNYIADMASSWELPSGRRLRYHPVPASHSRLDLEMGVSAVEGGLALRLAYATDLFTAAEATALVDRYQHILRECAGRPDVAMRQLDLWTPQDRRIATAAAEPAGSVAGSVYDLIASQARDTPDADALVDGDHRICYRDLLGTVGARADELRRAGVGVGGTVEVPAVRSAGTIVAALAAWACGATVLPTRTGTRGPAGGVPAAPGNGGGWQDAMVLLRGSGGAPRQLRHTDVTGLVTSVADRLGAGPGDVMWWAAEPDRDLGWFEPLLALAVGATVQVAPGPGDGSVGPVAAGATLAAGPGAALERLLAGAAPPLPAGLRFWCDDGAPSRVTSRRAADAGVVVSVVVRAVDLPGVAVIADADGEGGIPTPTGVATIRNRAGEELPPGLRGTLWLARGAGEAASTGLHATRAFDGTVHLAPAADAVDTSGPGAVPEASGLLADLVTLWQSLLQIPAADADTHFFSSGGDSLLAARLVSRINKTRGVKVPLRTVFRSPTPARLAAEIAASQPA